MIYLSVVLVIQTRGVAGLTSGAMKGGTFKS